jgi:dTDP-4-dehydrorhamnose reductase
MMRVVITGGGGTLGRELTGAARARGWDPVTLGHQELDIAELRLVEDRLASLRPEAVINAAAYTAVDRAESEPEAALRANRDGPRVLARVCHSFGVPLVQVSTDYVFDGVARRPYSPSDPVNPLNAYGRSKWEGEVAVRDAILQHLIVRTSWSFAAHGRNFLTNILRLASERDELRIVNDQYGSPTSASDLAAALLEALMRAINARGLWGTYHFANAGETTWFHFAEEIVRGARARTGIRTRVLPIPSSEYTAPAKRPRYSVLDTTNFTEAFGVAPRRWQDALEETLGAVAA